MWQSISYYAALGFKALIGVFGIRLYEEPRYELVDRVGDRIEIRRYAPRVAAQVELPTAGEAGRNQAFRLLFSYIAGANRAASPADRRIAMTSPVEVREPELIAMTTPVQTQDAGGVRMRFFLPARFTRESAPEPTAPSVHIVTVPEETIAVLRFSGSGGDIVEQQAALAAGLASSQWEPVGGAYTLFYDPPFTLPFLRRNEAAVEVATLNPG
jgi:hypothetical protein